MLFKERYDSSFLANFFKKTDMNILILKILEDVTLTKLL